MEKRTGKDLLSRIVPQGGHAVITHAALEVLPGWVNHFWRDELEALVQEYSGSLDIHVGKPQPWRRYCRYPDGTEIAHGISSFRYLEHRDWYQDYWHYPFLPPTARAMEFLAGRMITAIRQNKARDAAKFGGVLSHFIADSAAPPHLDATGSLDGYGEALRMLFPPPPKMRFLSIHAALEQGLQPFSLSRRPRLAGGDLPTTVFNLTQQCGEVYSGSKAQIPIILQAVYREDSVLEQQGKRQAAALAGQCLADAYYTIFRIAAGKKFMPPENRGTDLYDKFPLLMTAWLPAPYQQTSLQTIAVNYTASAGRLKRKPVLPALRIDTGATVKYRRAIGCGAPFVIRFHFPQNAFRRFTCRVGPHADLGVKHRLRFSVATDRGRSFEREFSPKRNTGVKVAIELKNANTLTLNFSGPGRGVGGDHLVIAEPTVYRRS